jgi:hypothetical protein
MEQPHFETSFVNRQPNSQDAMSCATYAVFGKSAINRPEIVSQVEFKVPEEARLIGVADLEIAAC